MNVENVLKVWHTAKNPIGYSISSLSKMTGIDNSEVKKIVASLKEYGFIAEKKRFTFSGWVSEGNEEDVKSILKVIK